MATFYIQLSDRLLKIGSDVTQETIFNALGYIPSSFTGNFNDLIDNPFVITDNGEFNIVDENGNVAARFDAQGLHVVDVTIETENAVHKLSQKADKSYVDNLVFDSNDNLPFKEDDSGSLVIADEQGNIGAIMSKEGITAQDFYAGNHRLTNKVEKDYVDNRIADVQGDYTSIIENVNFYDLKENPFNSSEIATFKIADEKGNVKVEINNNGITSTDFIVGSNKLSKKADLEYVDNRFNNLNSSVTGVGTTHRVAVTVNEANGKLTSIYVDDKNIDFNSLLNNPIEDNGRNDFCIIDNDYNIGFQVDAQGAIAQDFRTSSNYSLNSIGEKMYLIENLVADDSDNIINSITDILQFFENTKEGERAASLIATVSTHTSNIGTLNSSIQTNKTNISSLSGKTTTISSNVSTISGQCATMSSDISTLKTSAHTHTNKSAIDSITQDQINKWDSIDLTSYVTQETLQSLIDELNTLKEEVNALKSQTDNT